MLTYKLEVLDEKVLTVLMGLVDLSHIKLVPLKTEGLHDITDAQISPVVSEPKRVGWKRFQGFVS